MTDPQTPSQAAEAAAIRRRWITLGEVLAVIAVTISGLTLWNSYTERSAAEAERAAAKQEASQRAQTLLLKGEANREGSRMTLTPLDPEQAIQSLTIAFPSALETDPVGAIVQPRIEAGWIEDAVRKVRREMEKGPGDARLPVAVTTRFVNDGTSYSDTAIYDIGFGIDSSFLGGTEVELKGLSLIERPRAPEARDRLDAIWNARQPTISSAEKK